MPLYNENNPWKVEVLRNLVNNNSIAGGIVDSRSLLELDLDDCFLQTHFCAGIGLWSLALSWAGIPHYANIWSFSLPCQPFSVSGARKGFNDDRHLWPHLFGLIKGRRPGILCFEQTSSPLGLDWLDTVWSDLESEGYRGWTFDLCAPLVGAPHQRQRLYGLAYADNDKWRATASDWYLRNWTHPKGNENSSHASLCVQSTTHIPRGDWSDAVWLQFPSGSIRPIERGTYPLAYGNTEDLAAISAYGDAIVPQLAADFMIESMKQLCIEAGLVNVLES